ncbi:MAG TPA: type 4a pilus biogenesis protein PilO [Gemmatimonadaceae bacterium]|nr:type 4a pilus biogenesis protein PilO [Gemmatimonadaceae bacterium]
MPLLPTNERDQKMVLLGLLGIVAVAAYWYFYLDPRTKELATLETRIEDLRGLNERAKLELARGDPESLRREALAFQQNLEAMRQLVPTSNEVPALLEQVSNAARRVGLEITGVEPSPVLPGDQFDTYRYKLTLTGEYHAVGAFLANVGSLTRIVAPVNLQLKPQPPQQQAQKAAGPVPPVTEQPLQTEFEIQTYVARAGAGAAAPETTR